MTIDVATATQTFRTRLGEALTGAPHTPLVFLGNFEVEDRWAVGEAGLPRFGFGAAGGVIVNSMCELALLLGAEQDHVLLKTEPDPAYLEYLTGLGLAVPHVLTPREHDPGQPVTADALADAGLLTELAALAPQGHQLAPHGVSEPEEELARRCGLPLAGPPAAIAKTVNSKIYSRDLATELGLRQAAGWTCRTLGELADALDWAWTVLAVGGRVVVKDAFGVSGKGIAVIGDADRLGQLRRLIESRGRRQGRDIVSLVVEEWVAKRADLNYQFTVARDGSVSFDFVKEALTADGVHKGHRFPASLTVEQRRELTETAMKLGARLAADGYFGVVGVDAMIDPNGGLYPVVEINARYNMSTYQAALQEAFITDGQIALARHYPLRLRGPMSFAVLRQALDGLMLTPGSPGGLVVHNFATVNAAVNARAGVAGSPGGTHEGRLYAVLVADSAAALDGLDEQARQRLQALAETGAPAGSLA